MGCSKVHTGCENCYAEVQADKRGWAEWGPKGSRRKTGEVYWRKPVTWDRKAAGTFSRPRVFPSLCDPFEDWEGEILGTDGKPLGLCRNCWDTVPAQEGYCPFCEDTLVDLTMDHVRGSMFELIGRTPHLDWLLLTKRPENVLNMWSNGLSAKNPSCAYRKNVWLIYSASDQKTLEAGIESLFECRDLVPVLGLSLEPLIGAVDLTSVARQEGDYTFCDNILTGFRAHKCGGYHDLQKRLDWVIVGGESGPGFRECNLNDLERVAGQCVGAGVPCFVKQDSGPQPGRQGRIPGDAWANKSFPDIVS